MVEASLVDVEILAGATSTSNDERSSIVNTIGPGRRSTPPAIHDESGRIILRTDGPLGLWYQICRPAFLLLLLILASITVSAVITGVSIVDVHTRTMSSSTSCYLYGFPSVVTRNIDFFKKLFALFSDLSTDVCP